MIASIQGIVQSMGEAEITVEVGGVGLHVHVPDSVLANLPPVGRQIFLHTYLVVRDDLLALYGFSDVEEREIFEMLLGVSGVGPRLALAVISNLSLDLLQSAIVSDQPDGIEQCASGHGLGDVAANAKFERSVNVNR